MNSVKYLAFLIIIDVSLCSITSKTTELRVNLTADYDMNVRPGLDSDSPLVINIAMNLVALTKLNEVERYISTVQFFDITWNDERMSWKPELYENVSHLSFPSGNVWTPELIIANSADQVYSFNYDPWTVHFNHTGLAFWRPGLVTKTLCDIETPTYPFDEHNCYISVILWDALSSDVTIATPLDIVATVFYTPNSEWSLIETTARVSTTHYFRNIAFGLKFRRQSAFLVINILIPIVFLSLINPVVFLLPHESGERVAFSVTILLSFTVFLNVVGGNVPKTSSPLPMLCHYVVIVLITSGIITVLNTLYQRLYHTRGHERIPKWLQGILCIFSSAMRNRVADSFVTDDKHMVVTIKNVLLLFVGFG